MMLCIVIIFLMMGFLLKFIGGNMFIKILALIMFAILLSGCDAERTIVNPDVKVYKNYLPLKVGNYWIYSVFEIDINGNKINDSKRVDSMVIVDFLEVTTITNGNIYKQKAYKFNNFSDGKLINTEYFSIDNNCLYVLRDKQNFIISDLEPVWVKLTDQNNTKWNSFQYNNDNYPLSFLDKIYNSNFEVTINTQYIYSDKIINDLGEITFSQFQELVDTRALFDYDNINAVKFYKNTIIYNYADSIGLVYYYSKPSYQRFLPINSDPKFPTTINNVNGLEKTLIRYKLN